jgi:hypothetical protein
MHSLSFALAYVQQRPLQLFTQMLKTIPGLSIKPEEQSLESLAQ